MRHGSRTMVNIPITGSRRTFARRLSKIPAWKPSSYTEFAQERLRPARDLLHRVPKISANIPDIIDAGCGQGGPSKLLLERFPAGKLFCLDSSPEMLNAARADEALNGREMVRFMEGSIEEHFSSSTATSGSLYDLIFANASLHWCEEPAPELMARMLARVRPGGSLAVQMPDNRGMESHVLLREVASEAGLSAEEVARVPSNRHEPLQYEDALLGPLCQGLDMWSTTYVQRLEGTDPVYRYIAATAMRPLLAAFGGEESEQAQAFQASYRQRVASAYPQSRDGRTTLFPFTRFFIVAKRPSLLDVYSEYAAYHDHQLTKGWKS